jgi:hypothetical protein
MHGSASLSSDEGLYNFKLVFTASTSEFCTTLVVIEYVSKVMFFHRALQFIIIKYKPTNAPFIN